MSRCHGERGRHRDQHPLCQGTRSGLSHPVQSEKDVAAAYGVLSPTGGVRRWTFYIGPDGKILFIDNKVSTSTAGEDSRRLGELGVKK